MLTNQHIESDSYAQHISMKINFGKILNGLMKEHGINQMELAKQLGIRQSQVSNWLNGKSLPGYYSLKLLCEHLDVSADFLLEN